MKILAFDLSTTRAAWPGCMKMSILPLNGLMTERIRARFLRTSRTPRKNSAHPIRSSLGLGPGSYAGTRIAISAAIGLQVSSGARLIGFPSICAMESAEYCVIGDARRNSFFFAHVRANELVEGPTLFAETELRGKLGKLELGMSIFCSESLPQFERAVMCYPSARVLARLAGDGQRSFSLPPLEPIYLREPHITMPKVASPK